MKGPSVPLILSGEALRNPHVGVGVYAQRLIRGLLCHPAAPEFRVAIEEGWQTGLSDLPESLFLKIAPLRGLPHPLLHQIAFGTRLGGLMRRRFPETILHAPGPMWAPRGPARLVVTLHDCIYRHFPLYLGRFWLRRWLAQATERFAAGAARVLTVSQFSADELARHARIPREKLRVIYNWVGPEFALADRAAAAAEVRRKYQLPERFWLYLGGYDYRKNVGFLLEAYAAARQSAVCPPLVLAGAIPRQTQPPYSDPVGKAAALGLREAEVHFPGSIAGDDLPGLHAAAELLVYPSLYEGFGLPPAEAMAVGTPVLVADTSSLPEVVTRPECRFDPRALPSLVEKLVAAARAPQAFRCPLRPEFREAVAIERYLEAVMPDGGWRKP